MRIRTKNTDGRGQKNGVFACVSGEGVAESTPLTHDVPSIGLVMGKSASPNIFRRPPNYAGERYGKLTVVSFTGEKHNRGYLWLCQCDCGNSTKTTHDRLVSGAVKSCGCLRLETLRNASPHNKLPPGESAFNQFLEHYKTSARRRGYEFSITKDEFRALTKLPCFYCGAAPVKIGHMARLTNGHYEGNGLDRIDNSIGYVSNNVRPCCRYCNWAKRNFSEQFFKDWVARVYSNFVAGRVAAQGCAAMLTGDATERSPNEVGA